MQRLIPFLLGALCLIVVGFVALSIYESPPEFGPGAKPSSSSQSSSIIGYDDLMKTPVTETGARYETYNPRSPAQQSVLFFALKDDPFSNLHDTVINMLIASGSLALPVFKVDYGTSTGTRLQFGVVVPDTFVSLNESGARVSSLIHPSSAELRALLSKAHTSTP